MPPLNVTADNDDAAATAVDNVQTEIAGSTLTKPATTTTENETLEVDYDKNITQLYEAICNTDWETAISTSKTTPDEARTWVLRYDDEIPEDEPKQIMWRFLPIHSACARQPPANVISALIKAYPDGPKCVDDQGMYPLHYACGNQASREVIRLLLVAYPYAAKISDPRGMLPIHYLSCWGPSTLSIIDMVLVANRDVANAKDIDGNTPLDLAMDGQYKDRDVVVDLLRRWLSPGDTASISSSTLKSAATVPSSPKGGSKKVISIDTSLMTSLPRNANNDMRDDISCTTPVEVSVLNKLRHEVLSLKQEKHDFDKVKKSLTTSIDEKTSQLEEKNSTIKDLELQIKEGEMLKQKQVYDLEQSIDEKNKTIQEKTDRIDILDEQVKTKDTLYESTHFQLTKVEEELTCLKVDTTAKITELEEHLKEKTDLLTESTKRISYLETSLSDKEKNLEDTRSSLIDTSKQLCDLQEEKEKQVTDLSDALDEKGNLLEQTETNLAETTQKLNSTESELSDTKAKLDYLQGEHDKYKLKCYHVEEQLDTLMKGISKMNQRNAYLKKQNMNYNERLHSASELRYYKLKQLLTFEEQLMKSLDDDKEIDEDVDFTADTNEEETATTTSECTKLSVKKFDDQEKEIAELTTIIAELMREGHEIVE